jgi:hypothetical protein
MTTIERIGQFTIAQHGTIYVVIDRETHTNDIYHTERDARDATLERVDLVDYLEATVH